MMPFSIYTMAYDLVTLTFVSKIAFLDFVAAGGIAFHKHMYFSHWPINHTPHCKTKNKDAPNSIPEA